MAIAFKSQRVQPLPSTLSTSGFRNSATAMLMKSEGFQNHKKIKTIKCWLCGKSKGDLKTAGGASKPGLSNWHLITPWPEYHYMFILDIYLFIFILALMWFHKWLLAQRYATQKCTCRPHGSYCTWTPKQSRELKKKVFMIIKKWCFTALTPVQSHGNWAGVNTTLLRQTLPRRSEPA